MSSFYSVAVDGPSGAGKSTLSRRCAAAFGFIYVDTGAIYRTIALAARRRNTDVRDENEVKKILPELEVGMVYDDSGEQRMLLNGEDVSSEIRMPDISVTASAVAALPAVRAYLLEMQRKIARENNVIMDGRDIGTVVLPDAQLKIFLTASPEARAERRLAELRQKGIEQSYESVLSDIIERDRRDTSRAAAPLRKAENAVTVDTSMLNFEESFEKLCGIISSRLHIERLSEKE